MADYIITIDAGDKFLCHHGKKGMKWGVWNAETAARYNGTTTAKPSSAKQTAIKKTKDAKDAVTDKVKKAKESASEELRLIKENPEYAKAEAKYAAKKAATTAGKLAVTAGTTAIGTTIGGPAGGMIGRTVGNVAMTKALEKVNKNIDDTRKKQTAEAKKAVDSVIKQHLDGARKLRRKNSRR